MKIALAAVGFYEWDIEYNRNKILKYLKENSGKVICTQNSGHIFIS
jgi:N-carbamoylputrescine amidase